MERPLGPKVFLVLLLLSAILLLRLFWTYVSALVLALLLASVFSSVYMWAKNKLFRNRETPASLFMILLILVGLVTPASWFVGTVSNEAFDFYTHTRGSVSLSEIQELMRSDSVWVVRIRRAGELVGVEFTPEKVTELATAIGRYVGLFLYKQVTAVASNLVGFLIHFFLMLLTLFFLFRDGERLREYLMQLLPVPTDQLEKVVNKFREMARAIIVGNGLSGIVQGVLGGLGFSLFGLPSPFLWGTVMAFMAFLPIIGASFIYIPATVILLAKGKIGAGIGFLIYNILYSSIIEYLIKPRLIGQGMKMNSLLVFIGIIGGLKLFGIMGLVYGPLIITVFLTLAEIYRLEYKEHFA
ncbi:MAG: AI-2E family transporter [Deltaproteobacteria bacterium]|nr:AI-2E family transporter [Deltaproteobacteria bacterium]